MFLLLPVSRRVAVSGVPEWLALKRNATQLEAKKTAAQEAAAARSVRD
jgi:hypothetical protein